MQQRKKECGFRSLAAYQEAVLTWSCIALDSDLPKGFDYGKHNDALVLAADRRDPRILREALLAKVA